MKIYLREICNKLRRFYLTFMGPCIVITFYYINPNKKHMLQSYQML